jgi:hypothetical protein
LVCHVKGRTQTKFLRTRCLEAWALETGITGGWTKFGLYNGWEGFYSSINIIAVRK